MCSHDSIVAGRLRSFLLFDGFATEPYDSVRTVDRVDQWNCWSWSTPVMCNTLGIGYCRRPFFYAEKNPFVRILRNILANSQWIFTPWISIKLWYCLRLREVPFGEADHSHSHQYFDLCSAAHQLIAPRFVHNSFLNSNLYSKYTLTSYSIKKNAAIGFLYL